MPDTADDATQRLALLDDPSPDIRETAAYQLAQHPAHATVTLPALQAR